MSTRSEKPSTNMAEKTELSKEKGMETEQMKVHLFNCDKTYKFGPIRTLLSDVENESKWKFSIEEHYFPLPKMSETCDEIPKWEMDFAVFVVHANESRLSLNEEKAGIGYAKIYRTLLRTTNDRVLIVIGGDDNYKDEETSQVLSQWAKMKISSQFSTKYLDGRKSFVFSWVQKHRHIHKDALLHFLNKKGEVFVHKPRPQPKVPEKNMDEKELAGELTSQSKTNQSQASREEAPKIKDVTLQTVKPMPTGAGATHEKKQFDTLHKDSIGTGYWVVGYPKEEKAQSLDSRSACAVSEFPQTDSEYPKEQQYNDQENKSRSSSQAKSTYANTYTSGTHHVSPQPYDVPQPTKASSYDYEQSSFTKEKKPTENFGNHFASREVHQKSGQRKMKGNEEAPTSSVNVAIIECKVSNDRSVQVAHNFIYEVAKQLKLNPNIVSIKCGKPKSLEQKLIKYTENDSFSYVILLMDKEVFGNISTNKKKLTSYTNLLEEIQAIAETQAILIVCNDKDHIPPDQVHSKSVGNFLERVKSSEIEINEDHWITLSWNENEPNFSLEKHKQYLVQVQQLNEGKTEAPQLPGEYEAASRYKNTAIRRQGNYEPDLSANHDGRQMDHSMYVDSMVPSNASQGRPSNLEDKGNILWEGRIESGKLITTHMQPGWEPPDVVWKTIHHDNRHKSCTEFQVEQTEDGGFSILYGSSLLKKGKALVKAVYDTFF